MEIRAGLLPAVERIERQIEKIKDCLSYLESAKKNLMVVINQEEMIKEEKEAA